MPSTWYENKNMLFHFKMIGCKYCKTFFVAKIQDKYARVFVPDKVF